MSKVFGIDISVYQKGYDYKKASKEGVRFAIIRAGASRTKDSQFDKHYKNAKKQGWGVGTYWYTYATTVAEAKVEIKAFLKALKGKQFEYPVYLDIEDASIKGAGKTVLNAIVKAYGDALEKAGYYFGVYTNVDWYNNKISGATLNKKYDWWIASWTSKKPSGINAGLWQFGGSSNAIRSNKVAGRVTDQDYAYKDYPKHMRKYGKNGFKKEVHYDKLNLARVLQKGSTGTAVENLQKALNKDLGTKLKTDGIFGDATYKTVLKYQDKYGIKVWRGKVGKVMAHKLGWLWRGK